MKISLSILFLALSTFAIAQPEMMINGGFETVVNPTFPYPGYDYAIEYAPPWKSVNASADIDHPDAPTNLGGTPYQGEGQMRIAHSQESLEGEYAQGKTLDLVAGTTYEISFMAQIRFAAPVYIRNFGMMISTTDYSSSFDPDSDFDPQLLVSVGTSWVTGSYCFTAQSSGAHYVVLGGKCDPTPDDQGALFINVDNVSVKEISTNSGVPIANIADNQTQFCIDNIVLDGSNSSNETSYHWVIEQKISTGEYLCLYNQADQNGQAGLFNVNNAFASIGHSPGYGGCYRAYLFTSNACDTRDRLDFCIVNPNVFFITDGNPVCENIPRDLQVTGDNGWTYTWSTGQSGVGLKTVTITPTIGNSTYTVTVTTPEGCTSTKTITLVVNSQNNVAPWMDGINGTGEYTYYVQQNNAVFFNSLVSNDHLNEEIIYSAVSNTVPSGHVVAMPSPSGGIFSFSWVTSLNTTPGEYHYVLKVDDQNSCIAGIDTFDFRIIVVCDQCPICVDFENRTSGNNPLPPETKAGKCIEAGMSQVVSTGDANVLFQAGVSITEGPYFDAGPGFEAVIEPTTCITDCEDCCTDWDGFHFDNAYYTYINLWDQDPTNDHFELTDFDHPFCSYGSKRFDLYLDDADDGSNYAHFSGGGYQCCMLQTRTPENPIPHSSIFWDGYLNGEKAQKQYYRAMVYLYDCNDVRHEFLFSINVTSLSGMVQNNSDSVGQALNNLSLNAVSEISNTSSDSTTVTNEDLGIYPNPATNMLYISGGRSETTTIQLYDEKGRVLTKREKVALNQGYNLEAFSAGKYFCRIYKDDGTYVLKNFIKL